MQRIAHVDDRGDGPQPLAEEGHRLERARIRGVADLRDGHQVAESHLTEDALVAGRLFQLRRIAGEGWTEGHVDAQMERPVEPRRDTQRQTGHHQAPMPGDPIECSKGW